MLNELLPQHPHSTPEPDLTVIEESASNEPSVSTVSRELANNEEESFEDLRNKRYSSDTSDRQWLAVWTAVTVSIWLLSVLGILACNTYKFHLSDTVLTVLLGTTTLNVLGLSFIVLRGHFQSSKDLDEHT